VTRRQLFLLALAALSLNPAIALAHTYGPQDSRTIRADQIARQVTDARCTHVKIQRGDVRFARATIGCPSGGATITLARRLRSMKTLCRTLIHERYHIEDWRAKDDEAFRRDDGTLDYLHHRSPRSIMHPTLKARPTVCSG
jgi:hypothetical protein